MNRIEFGGSLRERHYDIEEVHRRIDRRVTRGMQKVLVELGLKEPDNPRPDDIDLDIRAVLEALEPPKEEEEMSTEVKYPHIHVRLTQQDSNAFTIIGRVSTALRRDGVSRKEIDQFRKEAMSGDYDNVLSTAARWVDVD